MRELDLAPPRGTQVDGIGTPLAYLLRRSRRARRPRLTIRPDGSVLVTLPLRAPERWAAELVAERRGWIGQHRERILEQQRTLESRPPLGAGRDLALGGIVHAVEVSTAPGRARRSRVVHEDVPSPTLRLELAQGEERPLASVLEPWLRAAARAAFERRVTLRARELGVTVGRLAIRDQRSRWGSASRRGALSFSWRLVMAPAWVLDYVVVHELVHLRDFSHSARFWALVRGLVPEAEAARRWLRAHDVDLRHALD